MDNRIVPVLQDEDCASASIYQQMLQGIRRAAARSKNVMKLFYSAEAIVRQLPHNEIVIVAGYEAPKLNSSLDLLLENGYRVVLAGLDGERFGPGISSVTTNRQEATSQLIHYLVHCGRERIALVGCGSSSVNDMMRCKVLRNFLTSRGVPSPDDHIFYYRENVIESIQRFYTCHRIFDAVICPNEYTALCLLRYCQDHGLRIPEDFYLCAFSNRLVGQYCSPSITTMAIDFSSVGEYSFYAWRFLKTHAENRMQLQITTPSRLIIRQSTDGQPYPNSDDSLIVFDADYQGEPFYADEMISAVMQIENCFASCTPLDLQIIHALLSGQSYEAISEALFISRSALNYRLKKIFTSANVQNRKQFMYLFQTHFTEEMNF